MTSDVQELNRKAFWGKVVASVLGGAAVCAELPLVLSHRPWSAPRVLEAVLGVVVILTTIIALKSRTITHRTQGLSYNDTWPCVQIIMGTVAIMTVVALATDTPLRHLF